MDGHRCDQPSLGGSHVQPLLWNLPNRTHSGQKFRTAIRRDLFYQALEKARSNLRLHAVDKLEAVVASSTPTS